MGAVGDEPRWVAGEGDDDRESVTELVEVVAHGDHVFLTRQSSQVAMQHEHQRPAPMVAEPE